MNLRWRYSTAALAVLVIAVIVTYTFVAVVTRGGT